MKKSRFTEERMVAILREADKAPVPPVIVQVTVWPATGSPAGVVRETVSAIGRASPGIAVCPSPATIVITTGGSGDTALSLPHALSAAARQTRPIHVVLDFIESRASVFLSAFPFGCALQIHFGRAEVSCRLQE